MAITVKRSDPLSKAKRSALMARVRSSGNKSTELRLIIILRAHRITGWRRNRKLTGSPDFAFPANRLAVFVDGCFWHSCPHHATLPKSNRPFWRAKLNANCARDQLVNRILRKHGWRVLRLWEHDLRHPIRCALRLQKLLMTSPMKKNK